MLITEANASERLGAVRVLHEAKEKLQKLEVIWVDQGYSGKHFAANVKKVCGEKVRIEVIKRNSFEFEILPKRWVEWGGDGGFIDGSILGKHLQLLY